VRRDGRDAGEQVPDLGHGVTLDRERETACVPAAITVRPQRTNNTRHWASLPHGI
jgi:hypothetical protein